MALPTGTLSADSGCPLVDGAGVPVRFGGDDLACYYLVELSLQLYHCDLQFPDVPKAVLEFLGRVVELSHCRVSARAAADRGGDRLSWSYAP